MFETDLDESRASGKLQRRTFLGLSVAALAGAVWSLKKPHMLADASAKASGPVTIIQFSDDGKKIGPETLAKVVKTDAEWRKQLSADEFEVTRHADTEMAFTGRYWNLHEHGLYRCICCNNALFNSDTKFESGTGWPSFWEPIAKQNVVEITDRSLGMSRTAVSCTLCDAHLGHVFDDGPKPTGLRYCMNSVSLKFIKI
jgi:peptide-methionine (R)-S-oxide reductase